jgi:hypothetical protein
LNLANVPPDRLPAPDLPRVLVGDTAADHCGDFFSLVVFLCRHDCRLSLRIPSVIDRQKKNRALSGPV